MTATKIKNKLVKTLAGVLLAAQIFMGMSFLAAPKAEAFWGIADFSFDTVVADLYDIAKDIGVAAAKRIAQRYANKFLQRFVNKIQEKYKIKNFLYYDQVLTSHILTNFIYDKVQDPDLRRIYTLLERNLITGQGTGYSGGSPRDQALLPLLKQAIADAYTDQTGIDPRAVHRPRPGMSNQEYFTYAQGFYFNNPGYTEAKLRSNYGAFQSAATTAAQLEILVGNSLKSGRILGGTCSIPGGMDTVPAPGTPEPKSSPTACEASGGVWVPSVVDNARSFISNPAAYVDKTIDHAFAQIFKTWDPDNIWSAIGASLGNYFFTQLELNDAGNSGSSALDEFGEVYRTDAGVVPPDRDRDTVDFDGIPDGEDADGDDDIDVCYHGGTPPDNCSPSSTASSTPYFSPLCKSGAKAADALREYIYFITTNRDHLDASGENFENRANADIWSRRTEQLSRAIDELISTIQGYHNRNWDTFEIAIGQYSSFISKVAQSLIANEDLDLARFGDGGGRLVNVIANSTAILDYIGRVAQVIGRCESPDSSLVATVPAPEIIDPGGGGGGGGSGACVSEFRTVSATLQGEVETAMDNALNANPALAGSPANPANVETYRQMVLDELEAMGLDATPPFNGNCNRSPNRVGVRNPGATMGESYDIVRDDPSITISQAASGAYSRPIYDGQATWDFLDSGIRS